MESRQRSYTIAVGQPTRAKIALQPPSLLLEGDLDDDFVTDLEAASGSDPDPDKTISISPVNALQHESIPQPEDAGNGEMPSPPSSMASSEYVRLLRDRISRLEDRNQAQQDEIQSLHRQRKAQANELQQILIASMQRARPQLSTHDTSKAQVCLAEVLKRCASIADSASSGLNCAQTLTDCAMANVAAEAELHRCAMQQAEFIRVVDGKYPNGLADMSATESRRMDQYRQELSTAAKDKDQAMKRLQALQEQLNHCLESIREDVSLAETEIRGTLTPTTDVEESLHELQEIDE
eukprot:TRINITY_DN1324_c0_g1_i1.p1 TRINITY_DN1324_c0_g1~~TRINITY_DN1324_c0_g1_i1.p1  ORF type:complete len:294 (+),score=51.36 TRINITY_DN1324_c0_g1_i1:64-945(+)